MAKRKGGLVGVDVKVTLPASIDLREFGASLTQGLDELAQEVAEDARASSAFHDKTGKLRKSIKVEKHPDGVGRLVRAKAPHAHLVEHGHALVTRDGKTIGHVAARPFLRPAAEKVISRAAQAFVAEKVK